VYREKVAPTPDAVAFFAYVCFFPQLVAGPIERAGTLLPQFSATRAFSYAQGRRGLQLILWGLLKKVVIADNCAPYVELAFARQGAASGAWLVLGAVLFAFQIYGDFSAYSDIARGAAKLLGFELMHNFRTPYFSRDIAEFWRRWHISLSTWFRDYVDIPLGGSRVPRLASVRNTVVVFLVSGFWHGANWTFLVWGGLNALYFLPLLLASRNRRNMDVVAPGRLLPGWRDALRMTTTFALVCLGWVFFRAASVPSALGFLGHGLADFAARPADNLSAIWEFCTGHNVAWLVAALVAIEWANREGKLLAWLDRSRRPIRWGCYVAAILVLLLFGSSRPSDFIYFQF
jgi:D-alanyl-lipoteichoic acid acyltransferase DltB (MBOAT superfamily)